MSMRYKGSRLSATANTPTSLTANGAWTLQQQMQANGTSTWPFVRDPQFNYVTMLLHGDGSAGANNGSGAAVTPTVTSFNADASTNNFNVTINGDARSNNFNPYQAGYYSNSFNNSALVLPASSALNAGTGNFTIEAWILPSSGGYLTGVTGGVLVFGPDCNDGFIRLGRENVAFDVEVNAGVVKNKWQHVAISRSGTTVYVFLDGVLKGTGTSSQSYTLSEAFVGDGGTAFIGYASNFRFVVGTALYTSSFTPSTTPLTAVSGTALLTCQSNRFIDNSTNAFTLTTDNSPLVASAQPFTLPSSVATYGSGYFSGTTGGFLNAPANTAFNLGTGDFTVGGWVYPTSTSGTRPIVEIRTTGGANGFALLSQSGATTLNVFTNSGFAGASSNSLTTNAWNYVALTRSGNTWTYWINGVSGGSFTNSSTQSDGGTTGPKIGGSTTSGEIWVGYLTDIFVVKGTALYSTTFTPPTSQLTAVSGTSLLTTQYNGGGNNSGFEDSSQNNFVITRNGNTTQGTFAPYGSNWSNYFNGSSDYLSSPADTALNMGTGNWTIECWVYISSRTLNYPLIFGNNNGSYSTGALAITNSNSDSASYNDKFFLAFYDVGTFVASGPTNSLNTWYHVAVVRNGTNISMYRNGASVISTTISAGITFDWGKLGTRIGGGNWDGAQSYFNGNISNLRVIKGTALYTSTFTPSTTPLTAISGTSLLTCADNRFVDDSTNNFTVTANGSPSVQRFSPFANATAYNPAVTGGSGYFDGSGDYLTAANNAVFAVGTGNFTIEAWVYPQAFSSYRAVFDTRTTLSNGGMDFGLANSSAGVWGLYKGSAVTVVQSSTNLTLNNWQHIAAVRSGSTVTLYLNGVSVGSATDAQNFSEQGCNIGRTFDGYVWSGYISNLRFNNSAVYTSAFTPPTAPLTPIPRTSLLLSTTNAGIFDQSMMNNLETAGNAAVSTSVKKYGAASMYFDGTGDSLSFPSNPSADFGTGDFTIECWLYVTSTATTYQCICQFGNAATTAGFHILTNTNTICIRTNGSQPLTTSGTISANTWAHIAITRSSGTTRIFINGTTSGGTYSWTASLSSGVTRLIGADIYSNPMTGYIDDFRVTKGVARYTSAFTVPDQAFPNG